MKKAICEACHEVETDQLWDHNFVCENCSARIHSHRGAFELWEAERLQRVFDQYRIKKGGASDYRPIIETLERVVGRAVKYGEPFESEHWWYIPEPRIGSPGFIVDKRDGNVKVLGSAAHLGQQFRDYNLGFRHDLLDLEVIAVRDLEPTVEFLVHQSLWHNPRHEVIPEACPSNGPVTAFHEKRVKIIHWRRPEIAAALMSLPFCFRSQRLHPQSFVEAGESLPFDYRITRGT